MSQPLLPNIKIKEAAVISTVLSIFVVVTIGHDWFSDWYKEHKIKRRLRNVECVAAARSNIKNQFGHEELCEAETIVDSTLPLATILNWPNFTGKEIN